MTSPDRAEGAPDCILCANGNDLPEGVSCTSCKRAGPAAEPAGGTAPEKILDHKWLDPKCIECGCQSLVWQGRYENAVKGRAEFRQAYREQRAAQAGTAAEPVAWPDVDSIERSCTPESLKLEHKRDWCPTCMRAWDLLSRGTVRKAMRAATASEPEAAALREALEKITKTGSFEEVQRIARAALAQHKEA